MKNKADWTPTTDFQIRLTRMSDVVPDEKGSRRINGAKKAYREMTPEQRWFFDKWTTLLKEYGVLRSEKPVGVPG